MKKVAITFISLFFLLTACQASDSNAITLEEVLSAFEEEQLSLKKSKISKDSNVFGMKLNGVRPFSYELDGKMLLVYIYNSKNEREKGWEDWREKTAIINKVSFNVYEADNVLLFYVYIKDLDIEVDGKIQDVLNELKS